MQSPDIGQVLDLAPGLRQILAPNPSPMTYWGTNTFLIGEKRITVVDPGPADADHIDRILKATDGRIDQILITHPHLDHSPGAARLVAETGATLMGYGPAASGLTPEMAALSDIGGGEGVDHDFAPKTALRDGDVIETELGALRVLETPGHFAGHLAFQSGDWILSGDHAMAWASSLISPPHGDLGAFRRTSQRLLRLEATRFFPAHGPELADPKARLEWLLAHRDDREAQLLRVLSKTPETLGSLTCNVYTDIDPKMLPAAERNLLAHLIDLIDRGIARADGPIRLDAKFHQA